MLVCYEYNVLGGMTTRKHRCDFFTTDEIFSIISIALIRYRHRKTPFSLGGLLKLIDKLDDELSAIIEQKFLMLTLLSYKQFVDNLNYLFENNLVFNDGYVRDETDGTTYLDTNIPDVIEEHFDVFLT